MRLRTLACLLVWPALGCQCDEEALGRVSPDISVDVAPLAFGEVPLGATKRLSIEVGNQGNAPLEILAVDAAAPFGVEPAITPIEPGMVVPIEVWFRPTNDEPQSGTLLISSNDPDAPMLSVPLTGVGVQGVLTVLPSEVDLTNTKVGSARSVELVLDNRGLEPVEGTIVPVGFAQPEHFALTLLSSFGETAPFAVPGRADQILELVYQPLDVGTHEGRIVFEICGPRCGLEVEVSASASASAVRLAPPVLDFGEVGIGETSTLQLRLENAGNEDVQVEEVTISGSPDLAAQVTRALPVTVGPADALGINVEFTPASAAEVMGEVVVRTGPVREEVRAAVVGRGVGPLFRVEPETLSFGVERVPQIYRRALLLVNAGSSDVRVTSVTATGDPAFSIDALPGLPVRLGSGESLVATVLFNPGAIQEYRGTVVVESDDVNAPRVEVPVTGALTDRYCELAVSPQRISFGLLPPTYSRVQRAIVENVGSDPCNITGATFRLPTDPAITELTQPWPGTLQPGDTAPLDFQYAPTIEAESKATYVMRTDDPVFPERTVGIFGTSVGNLDVFARPNAVDFGAMSVGCTKVTQEILLFNAGTIDVDVSNVVVTSSSAELTLDRVFTTPTRLFAGAVLSMGVGYGAADIGTDLGDVKISVATYGFDITVPLRGEGAQSPRVTDRFEQARNDKVDVLFVIDDSCSMSDDQAALAANFSAFIRQADVRQVDFRIGITTTTVFPVPGQLRGPVMSRQTSNLETVFQTQAAVGISGSGFEQGLEAMFGALQAGDRAGSPQSELARPDAVRVVIIVSDENDQSPLATASYFNELRQRAPNGLVTAMVSGQMSGCSSPTTGSASPAPRYVDFARLTGGLDESICSNWANTLSNIGQAAFGLRSRFLLSRSADQTQPIVVRVDGVVMPAGWQYDPTDDAIQFDSPPPEGAQIEVEYTPVC